MPYANGDGVRIYYEVEGQGPPLVLGHGGGDSLEMWRRAGYTDALNDAFQLILFDLPGHGKSEKYDRTEDGNRKPDLKNRSPRGVVAVLDSLGIEKAHYFGYSAGASLGFRLALHHAERFQSFVLGGMTPYAWPETMVKAVDISIDLYKQLLAEPEQYLLRMQRLLGRPLTAEDREHFLNQDAEARIAGLSSLIDSAPMTDGELASISTPCLIFCGELDPFHAGALEAARHMPRVRFVSMPDLDHIGALTRRDLVVPHIKKFIDDVS